MVESNGSAPKRVVLLGASNLTRGISTVVETARNIWGRPLEILSALGHGRSYGLHSSVLGRRLPAILECGLWDRLAGRPKIPTAALITDIGNDLIYQVEPPQVAQWVEAAILRLRQHAARITMTLLPIGSLAKLSPKRFYFFRAILFPTCRLGFEEVQSRAHELHDRLVELGRKHSIRLVEQRADWYGFDPIHIRTGHWPQAWREILMNWHDEPPALPPAARGSVLRWLYLCSRAPQQRWLFGIERRRQPPHGRLRDGSTVSFF